MPDCVSPYKGDKRNLKPADEAVMDMIGKSYDIWKRDSVLRYILSLSPHGGNVGMKNWNAWIRHFTGAGEDPLTMADAQRAVAELTKIQKAIKRIGNDETGLRAFLKKVGTLPVDQMRLAGLGDIHLDTAIVDQMRDTELGFLTTHIKELYTTMDAIHGRSSERAAKKMAELEAEVSKAQAAVAAIGEESKGGGEVGRRLGKAKLRLTEANEALDKFLSGDAKGGDEAGRMLRDFGMVLDGSMKRAEFRKIWSRRNSGAVRELLARGDAFMYGSTRKAGHKINEKTGEIEEVEHHVGGFLPMLKSAVRDAEENIFMMLRASGKYGEADAREAAQKMTTFTELKNYYPHKNLMAMYWAMQNAKAVRSATISGDFTEVDGIISKGTGTGIVMERTTGSRNISWNSVNVLAAYGEEVIRYKHANKAARILNEFIHGLGNVDTIKVARDKHKGTGQSDALFKYYDNVRKMLMAYAHDMLDTRVPTFMDDAVSTLVAHQAFVKLSSPSTSALNRAEGILHYFAWNGFRRNLSRFRDTHSQELGEILAKASTNFRAEDAFDVDSGGNRMMGMRRYLSEADVKDHKLLTAEMAQIAAQKAKAGVGKLATAGMKVWGWDKAENANRREAFMLGAAEALMYINNKWYSRFMSGNVPEYMIRRFRLKKDGDQSNEARWEDFKEKYVIRQGYRAMFQTQFQYTRSQRNMLDKNSATKLFHMFQHYPRSLASQVAWAAYDVKNLYEVAGLKGIFSRTTRESLQGGFVMNQNMQYLMSIGAIHMMRQAIRASAGIVLGQLASHPLQEIVEDLVGYFNDDEPEDKQNRFWGRGVMNEVTGPAYSELMDALSLAALKLGMDSGELPTYLTEAARLTTGFRPNATLLSENGRRDYNNITDVVRETFLWDSMAIYPKSMRIIHAIQAGDSGKTIQEVARAVGIRPDYKRTKEVNSRKERDPKN